MNTQKSRQPKHFLTDWLNLHGLDPDKCHKILTLRGKSGQQAGADAAIRPAHKTQLSTAEAWQLVSNALLAAFPDCHQTIEDVQSNTKADLRKNPDAKQRPLTLHDGGNGYPYIRCGYDGRVAELIYLQHEFAHAVQLVASQDTFLPPVLRECCAFIGELALLDHLRHKDADLFSHAEATWQFQDARIFRRHQSVLETALGEPGTPYNYNWNYPIARILSAQINDQLTHEQKWQLFCAKTDLNELLEQLAI